MKKKCLFGMVLGMVYIVSGCSDKGMPVVTSKGDGLIDTNGVFMSNGEEFSEEHSGLEEVTEKSDSSSDLIRIGFAQVGSESDWRMAQSQSIKEAFTKEKGYDLSFVDCNNNHSAQIEAVQGFIDDGLDYIIIDPIVEDGYEEVLRKAQNADIPVIVVDRNINVDDSLYTCWVGSNFEKEGESAGKWLDEYLKERGMSDEQVNILTIQGTLGASAQIGRSEGFASIMKEHSNWKMLDEKSGDFTEDGGYAVMGAFLNKYQDFDVLICQNDNEAYGAIDAMKEKNISFGVDGDVAVISFDATKGGFERMIDGEINVNIECNPLEGSLVEDLVQRIENGDEVEKVYYVDEGVFKAEDAASIIDDRAY